MANNPLLRIEDITGHYSLDSRNCKGELGYPLKLDTAKLKKPGTLNRLYGKAFILLSFASNKDGKNFRLTIASLTHSRAYDEGDAGEGGYSQN
jgi:hypothetical protein